MKLVTLTCLLVAGAFAAPQLEAEPFRAGREYVYDYDAQASSGLADVEQRAIQRLAATARIQFESDKLASLSLENVRFGQVNAHVDEPAKMIPVSALSEDAPHSLLESLRTPCKFELVDGLVGEINFVAKENSFAKNIKRGLLNLLQANIQQRPSDKAQAMFNVSETTLEGQCQTMYTVNKVSDDRYNWTKSIDFNDCKRSVATTYGLPAYKPVDDQIDAQIDRSTVISQQLVSNKNKYGVAQARAFSQYTHKALAAERQPMQTVVISRLVLKKVEKKTENVAWSSSTTTESLLYQPEYDTVERRFYELGDEEFTGEHSPFGAVTRKVETIAQTLKQIAAAMSNAANGIATEQSMQLQQVVSIIRMCTVQDLKSVHAEIQRDGPSPKTEKMTELFTDACAIAATRNSIVYLVDEIKSEKIPTTKAVQAMQQLAVLYAPSTSQIEAIAQLCKSDVALKKPALRQACVLSHGAAIAQLCSAEYKKDMPVDDERKCTRAQKDKYAKALYTAYERAENQYERILALKAIGNAACESCVDHLAAIIRDAKVEPIVRQQAIDSLRRLRTIMPRKIQRILLPVFKNTLDKPEVRMTALAMIFHTRPSKAVVDQCAHALLNEPRQQVKAYAYSLMKSLAKSPLPVERKLAAHLAAVLKAVSIDESAWPRGKSYFKRVPIYAAASNEGLFLDVASIFTTSSMLPQHIQAHVDRFLNGMLERSNVDLEFSQHGLDRYYDKVMKAFHREQEQSGNPLRGRRSENKGEQEIDNIFDTLAIKKRISSWFGAEDDETVYAGSEQQPIGIMCIRVSDIDSVVLPVSDETLPEPLRKIVNGESLPISSLASLFSGKRFQLTTAAALRQRGIKIPTSCGMPLDVQRSTPITAAVKGELKLKVDSEGVKVLLSAHPSINAVHIDRMLVWSPMALTGVESLTSASLNLPIDIETHAALFGDKATVGDEEMSEKIRISIKFPQSQTRLGGFHTMPYTLVQAYDAKTQLLRPAKLQSIRNLAKEALAVDLDDSAAYGLLPASIKVHGHMHRLERPSYPAMLALARVTENHVVVDFEPSQATAQSIDITLAGRWFQRTQSQLAEFDEQTARNTYDNQDYEEEASEKLSSYGKRFSARRWYRHALCVTYSARDASGSPVSEGKTSMSAVCDSKLRFCKLTASANADDKTFALRGQMLMPEKSASLRQLRENAGQQQKQFVAQANVEFGDHMQKQKAAIKVQGVRALPKWLRCQSWSCERATAFVNKYTIEMDSELSQHSSLRLANGLALFKAANWQSVESSKPASVPAGKIVATLVIDPLAKDVAQLTYLAANERVHMKALRLPAKVAPFRLVALDSHEDIDSVSDLIDSVADEKRAQCSVTGRKVWTFDNVAYKAPIGKSYSVIAKDCANKQFAVLLKTIDAVNGEKKLKVVSRKNTIEVCRKSGSRNDELEVSVNGQVIDDEERLNEHDITLVDGQVTLRLPQKASIRFDGYRANVRIAPVYKNAQCGLCGHYDDESDNEFLTNDGENTDDIKAFHRSYSLDADQMDDLYARDDAFGRMDDSLAAVDAEDEHVYQTRYDYKFAADKKNDYDRQNEDEEDNDEDNKEPNERTKVIEYNHKICFSQKPVKQCPSGWYPTKTTQTKVQFACFNRSLPHVRRLVRQARNADISDLVAGEKPTLVDVQSAAVACEAY